MYAVNVDPVVMDLECNDLVSRHTVLMIFTAPILLFVLAKINRLEWNSIIFVVGGGAVHKGGVSIRVQKDGSMLIEKGEGLMRIR